MKPTIEQDTAHKLSNAYRIREMAQGVIEQLKDAPSERSRGLIALDSHNPIHPMSNSIELTVPELRELLETLVAMKGVQIEDLSKVAVQQMGAAA